MGSSEGVVVIPSPVRSKYSAQVRPAVNMTAIAMLSRETGGLAQRVACVRARLSREAALSLLAPIASVWIPCRGSLASLANRPFSLSHGAEEGPPPHLGFLEDLGGQAQAGRQDGVSLDLDDDVVDDLVDSVPVGDQRHEDAHERRRHGGAHDEQRL